MRLTSKNLNFLAALLLAGSVIAFFYTLLTIDPEGGSCYITNGKILKVLKMDSNTLAVVREYTPAHIPNEVFIEGVRKTLSLDDATKISCPFRNENIIYGNNR
jgi:hypothetical protein